jgi:murein DD-endopeptidase MepM/ murein hydrolase activator NlpD
VSRRPLLGLALAGAAILAPLPLAGSGEGAPRSMDLAAAARPTPSASPQQRSSPPTARSPQSTPGANRPPAAGSGDAPDPATLAGYQWPLPRGRLTQPFGPTAEASRLVDGRPFHDGIDLATFCGDRIVAAHDGLVLAASRRFDRLIGYAGNLDRYVERLDRRKLWALLPIVVVIDDGNGYRSMYAHLGRVVVSRGERVRAGQLLGYEGATGNASGCHLHYGLFSPAETDLMEIRPDVARRWKLPRYEIARIDPLLVLPERLPATPDAPSPDPRPLMRRDGSVAQ